MNLSRRTILAGLAASPVAAPLVARAGSYSLKPVNDGFAAILETKDFGALVSDPVISAELQRKIHKHLILHVRPEVLLTKEVVGQMGYNLGYPKGGRAPQRRPAAQADGYGGQGAAPPAAPAPPRSEFAFVADFGGPAEPAPTTPRKPGYIETLHTDGGGYSINTTIDVPPATPHTFVDTQAAYRALPRDLKKIAETHFALHAGLATTRTPFNELPALDAKTALRRPLVMEHFVDKTPQLYLPKNPHSVIEGLPEDESRDVLNQLWARVNTQRNRYMAYSGENQAMIWDAFGTSHTNPSYRRDKARITWFFNIPTTFQITQAKIA